MIHWVCAILSVSLGACGAFLFGFSCGPRESDLLRQKRLGLSRRASRSRSPLIRLMHPLIWILRPTAMAWFSRRRLADTNETLQAAGLEEEISADEFLAYKIALPLAFAILWLLLQRGSLLFIPMIGALGYVFPDIWLRGRKRLRQREILLQLPFAVDLLTLSVEAGLDFSQALNEVAGKLENSALTEEIQKTMRQVKLGATRAEALRSLAIRTGLPELRSLTSVLIQADRLGVGIGRALRSQADRLRWRRYRRAEELGALASQKILVPLILFILPSVLILVLSAVGLTFMGG